jgi:hypothetical protein
MVMEMPRPAIHARTRRTRVHHGERCRPCGGRSRIEPSRSSSTSTEVPTRSAPQRWIWGERRRCLTAGPSSHRKLVNSRVLLASQYWRRTAIMSASVAKRPVSVRGPDSPHCVDQVTGELQVRATPGQHIVDLAERSLLMKHRLLCLGRVDQLDDLRLDLGDRARTTKFLDGHQGGPEEALETGKIDIWGHAEDCACWPCAACGDQAWSPSTAISQ